MQSSGGGLRCLLLLQARVPPIHPSRLPLSTPTAHFSSKTPIKSNLGTATSSSSDLRGGNPFPYEIPKTQGFNLVSQKQQNLQSPNQLSLVRQKQHRKRKEILRMDEKELEGYAILVKKPPFLERRGEATTAYLKMWKDPNDNKKERSYIDYFSFFHGDWDLRSPVVKRWWKSLDTELELKDQSYNPSRNKVLGNDLSISHFVVARKGRVRFRGHTEWVEDYRKDAVKGVDEVDLPVMSFDLCTLPVRFDPRFRVEAIDCRGIPIHYEGLANFQNLNFVKWLSFRNGIHLDDWCLDRITRIFYETLEYIDVSGCSQVSERGIGALVKCRNLKTLVVENLPHAKHLEMVTAMLEDQLPGLQVIGVDYAKKMEQIRLEGEDIERKLQAAAEELEANTITIEDPTSAEHHDEQQSSLKR